MPDNRINATLSAADATAVMDAINTIRTMSHLRYYYLCDSCELN